MTLQKPIPLLLLMFTVVCALPAAAGAAVVPSAIAQEEEDEENLASGIVSDVLDNSGNADDESNQDATNTGAEDSNQEQDVNQDDISRLGDDNVDLDDINVAVPIGIPIDVQDEEEEEEEEVPDDEVTPPDFAAFCLEITNPEEEVVDSLCFDTSEECAEAQEFLEEIEFVISMECEGVETFPPGALECFIIRDDQGEIGAVACP